MSQDYRQAQPKTPPDPPKPDDRLAELMEDLAKSQTQLDDITKIRDSLTAEIGTLTQVVKDTKTILAAYTAAYPGLDNDLKTIAGYDQTKMEFVTCKISKARQGDIDKIITDYNAATEKAQEDADTLKHAADCAQVDADATRKAYNTAQGVFNDLKGLLKSLTDKDSAAKKLMGDIDKFENNKNYDAMYLQLKDALEPLANDLGDSLLSVDTFTKNLYAAVLDQDTKWETLRQKNQDLDKKTKLASDAQKTHDDLVANRTAALLKLVAALAPAPPPAPTLPGASA